MNDSLPPLVWDDRRPHEVKDVEPLGEGDSFECFLLDGKMVVRLAKHVAASACLQREMLLLPLVQKHVSVEVPNIAGSGTVVDSGERFVAYPLVAGTPLAPEVLARTEPRCRQELIQCMAHFVEQLHRVPVALAGSFGVRELIPRQYLPFMMGEARTAISHHMSAAVWSYHQRLGDLYLDTPELQAYRPSFLHGDLSPDHLLVDVTRGVLTGVIDFSDCCIGDPLWDLIYIRQHYGPAVLAELLETYPLGEKHSAEQRVRIYQELNNVQYCLSMHVEGDEAAFVEGLQILTSQAAEAQIPVGDK